MDFLLAKIILNQVLILYIIFVTCYLSIYIYICLLYVKYTATKMSSNFSKPKQKLTET